MYIQQRFSFCGLLLYPVGCFLSYADDFSFTKSHLSIIGLNSWTNGVLFRKFFPRPVSCRHCLFSSSRFSVKGFSKCEMSSIHLEWVSAQSDRFGSLLFFCMRTSFPQHHLWTMLSFFQCLFLANINYLNLHVLKFWSSVLFHWPLCLFGIRIVLILIL